MLRCDLAGLCCTLLTTRARPLGGRHAAVIPALPEEYDSATAGAYHPADREKDPGRDRRGDDPSGSPPYQQISAHHLSPSPPQPLQPGVTQIVLPPPTSSETLNIQEYHPPPQKESDKRTTRGTNHAVSPSPTSTRSQRRTSRSPSARTNADHYPPPHAHHTRSSSRLSRPDSSSSTNQPSPYLANASPPPVPATFASILNAYPAPSASPRPGSSSDFTNGAAE